MMKSLLTAACAAATLLVLPTPSASAQPLPRVPDEGFQGPLHKKLAGRIIFSTKRIPRGPRSTAGHTTSFSLRDKIYLRPMLAESMGNTMRKNGVKCRQMRRRITKVQIDDAPPKKWVWLEGKATHHKNWDDWMTYSLDSDGKRPLNHGPTRYPKDKRLAKYRFGAELLPKLTPGARKLTFHVIAECYGRGPDAYKTYRFSVAKSTITLKVTKKDLRRHWKRKGPFLPRSKNRSMHRMMKRVVAAKWRTEKVLAARALDRKWIVYYHRYLRRRVTRRSINAVVVVRKKGAKRCRAFDLSFAQKSLNGRHRYGKTQLYVGSSYDFPCVNAR